MGVSGVGLNYVGAVSVGVLDVGVGVWIFFCGPQARPSRPVGHGAVGAELQKYLKNNDLPFRYLKIRVISRRGT